MIAGLAACASALTLATAQAPTQPTFYSYEIINTYPHDPSAYTQGLFYEDGILFESTGLYGESTLRRVEVETGKVIENHPLPDRYFGEGIVAWGDRLISLTYKAGTGFIFDKAGFEKQDEFSYDGEGWGLTHDGTRIIMSDGTPRLRYLDPDTLEQTGTFEVTYLGRPLPLLNELEFIDGEIFANIYQTDTIVKIDPSSGHVTGVIQLKGLLKRSDIIRGETDVLNGIAYDSNTDRLFVTGKKWPKLFEIELKPLPPTK